MLNDTPLRRCSKCHRALPATPEYFSKRNDRASGFTSWCKECCGSPFASSDYKICTKCKRGFPATAEHFGVVRGRITARCKSCRNEHIREWRNKNPDKEKAYQKRNRERYPEYHRERHKRYEEDHPTYRSEWAKKNRDKTREYERRKRIKDPNYNRLKIHRRKARKLSLRNDFTSEQWLTCLEYFNYCCAACGNQLRDLFGNIEPNADHWIPLVSPDCPGTTATNMMCLCNKCNNNKRARDAGEWLVDRFGTRKAKTILQRIETYFRWVREQEE